MRSTLSQPLDWFRRFGRDRLLTHAFMLVLALASLGAAKLYAPHGGLEYLATLGFGYLSLILVAVTLLIGPIQLRARRKNPVNVNLRRDIGIWAGITGTLHVVFGLTLHQQGYILLYFFRITQHGFRPLTNLFGLSNDVGLAATILLIALLVTSNDLLLRKLKGPRWKRLQQFNYVLAVLVLLHTLGYQIVSQRSAPFRVAVVAITVVTFAGQLGGIWLYRRRAAVRDRRWRNVNAG